MTEERIQREGVRLAGYLRGFSKVERGRVIGLAVRNLRGLAIEPPRLVVNKPSMGVLADAREIMGLAARLYKVDVGLLSWRGRGKVQVSEARGVAMAAIRVHFGRKLSFPAIGRLFHRDHVTVMHAVRLYADSVEVSVLLDAFRERKREERVKGGFAEAVRGVEMGVPEFQPVMEA